MDIKKPLLCGLLLGAAALSASAQERPLWLRYPAISPDGKTIAFAYQGDIYTVPTVGGEARRLTSTEAYECYPVWSPDGKQIAYTSDRNSSGVNIYIMPAGGGKARQLRPTRGVRSPRPSLPMAAISSSRHTSRILPAPPSSPTPCSPSSTACPSPAVAPSKSSLLPPKL